MTGKSCSAGTLADVQLLEEEPFMKCLARHATDFELCKQTHQLQPSAFTNICRMRRLRRLHLVVHDCKQGPVELLTPELSQLTGLQDLHVSAALAWKCDGLL